MVNGLIEPIGSFIHNCGVLELQINNTIVALGHDCLLSEEICKKTNLGRRVEILQRLLKDRTKLRRPDITCLIKELKAITHWRNAVAHNPASHRHDLISTEEYIINVRSRSERTPPNKITCEQLHELVERSLQASNRFAELLPECKGEM